LAVTLTINGIPYSFPQTGEENWGPPVTAAAVGLAAVTETLRTPATPTVATQGVLRLGSSDGVYFRNNANTANLGLTIDASDDLLFNGSPIGGALPPLTANRAVVSDGAGALTVSPTTDTQIGFLSTVTSNVQTQLDTKLQTVSDTATIDLTKTGVALSADIVAASITNTHVNASAAIAVTKLAAVTASRALVSDGSGFVSPSGVTATELGHVSGVTSPIQTQINNINTTITSLVFLTNGQPNLGMGYI
jgi:hypothetical protein